MSINEPQFENQIDEVAAGRQRRLRETMQHFNSPVMLILDSINIKYATGASNMAIFSTRTPARYLLIFAEGPAILYEYFGCEHLARNLTTINDVRPARGLCYVSSGGDPVGQAKAMAREIAATVDYLFAFAATTNAVRGHHFEQLYEAYLVDEAVRDFIADNNAPALAEIAARLCEAVDRGLWAPRRNSAYDELSLLAGRGKP